MKDRGPGTGSGSAWTLPEELRALAEAGEGEAVREVIAIFQTDTEVRIRSIHQALGERNAARVRAETHAVKGSAAQVGATTISDLCRRMEAAAGAGNLDEALRLLPELEAEFAAVRRAMAG